MKLRNKLILSCAALAAVATTAFSTTFAWYTANDTVKASGITGKTSEDDATLLLISETGLQSSWGAKVTIDSSAVTLDPVAYSADDDAYYPWDPQANEEADTAVTGGLTSNDKYISFYLYFKSGSSQSLNVKIKTFNLRNTTGVTAQQATPVLPTFTVLAAGTGSTSTTYSVDMLRATNVVLSVENGTEGLSGAESNPAITSNAVRTAYAADSAATGTVADTANAHTYYNNVKSLTGDDALPTNKNTSEESLGSIATLQPSGNTLFTIGATGAGATGTQDSILMVKFDIYLDGWDKLCFDAVRKQTFALDMEFTGAPVTTQQNNG